VLYLKTVLRTARTQTFERAGDTAVGSHVTEIETRFTAILLLLLNCCSLDLLLCLVQQ
jgi:hypothetical protein